jgi:hypothetical protein
MRWAWHFAHGFAAFAQAPHPPFRRSTPGLPVSETLERWS